MQPTGIPHLGNYLGAIENWRRLQEEESLEKSGNILFSVVDMHAITVRQNPDDLRKSTFDTYVALMACGIDPVKSTLFVQSHVPAHAELAWILSCNTTIGRLSQMTQFKV